jgi:hypothetical protein
MFTAEAYGVHTTSVNAALVDVISSALQNSCGSFFSIWFILSFGSVGAG